MLIWLIKVPQNALIFLKALKMLALMEFLDEIKAWILDAVGLQVKAKDTSCATAIDE